MYVLDSCFVVLRSIDYVCRDFVKYRLVSTCVVLSLSFVLNVSFEMWLHSYVRVSIIRRLIVVLSLLYVYGVWAPLFFFFFVCNLAFSWLFVLSINALVIGFSIVVLLLVATTLRYTDRFFFFFLPGFCTRLYVSFYLYSSICVTMVSFMIVLYSYGSSCD